MSSPAKRAQKLLADAINASKLRVVDESGGCEGFKFRLLIVSDAFNGKTTLQSHRLVQAALAPIMPETHALTICAYSPDKWSRMTSADQAAAGCADLAKSDE